MVKSSSKVEGALHDPPYSHQKQRPSASTSTPSPDGCLRAMATCWKRLMVRFRSAGRERSGADTSLR
jgi:hypothetical protein